jgi:hypothetical protein
VSMRRAFLNRTLGTGAGFALAARNPQWAAAGDPKVERNKAVVRRFM